MRSGEKNAIDNSHKVQPPRFATICTSKVWNSLYLQGLQQSVFCQTNIGARLRLVFGRFLREEEHIVL